MIVVGQLLGLVERVIELPAQAWVRIVERAAHRHCVHGSEDSLLDQRIVLRAVIGKQAPHAGIALKELPGFRVGDIAGDGVNLAIKESPPWWLGCPAGDGDLWL